MARKIINRKCSKCFPNNKYLKLYKLKSNLVNYLDDTLVSSVDFTHEDENVFLGFNVSVFETLKDVY